ncbi:hypothetical protein [Citricoccus sp. I39-566]|uniref:hypothetical protein n=1 Tax=Citricoccus sp. I39-566 TaxID=3073268 RepID=UPI00286A5204|nr:hypothetical protein [Citricoccus sp. I39-566]WMY80073.1 hypothetical protein RE421_16485 [Citricoccus sp. I39-566]
METHVRRCQNCAQPLPADARANRRYCDEQCRRQAYGLPPVSAGRRCQACGKQLPEGSRAHRRFCDPACQKAEARRRTGARGSNRKVSARDQLAVVSGQLAQAETALGQCRGRVTDRDREVAWLRAELAEAQRSTARILVGQANDAADVRARLALATGQLSELRRNWSATAEARVSTTEVTGLREQLAALQDRHGQLAAKYQELTEAAELAATERQHLQGVVRQWDTLCKRLYKATGGRPAAAVDRDILATWTRFRQAVATPTGNRGRAPVAGQEVAR